MRKFYLPLLMLLLLTLPFRGMAALGAMPGCMQHDAPSAAMSMSMDMHDCEPMHGTDHAPAGDHTCAFCADCCSMAMTGPVTPALAVADFRSAPETVFPVSYSGYQPEGPERPPKRTV